MRRRRSMGRKIRVPLVMELASCCECGMQLYMPEAYLDALRVNGGSFTCPLGHQNEFAAGQADLEDRMAKLTQENDALKDERATLISEKQHLLHKIDQANLP